MLVSLKSVYVVSVCCAVPFMSHAFKSLIKMRNGNNLVLLVL